MADLQYFWMLNFQVDNQKMNSDKQNVLTDTYSARYSKIIEKAV